eukprot:5451421-Prymnesium_polylepis.2
MRITLPVTRRRWLHPTHVVENMRTERVASDDGASTEDGRGSPATEGDHRTDMTGTARVQGPDD